MKIVADGFLKFGWAERNNKRTVFGKKPAICFSEQPLYAFIDYVLKRENTFKVDLYGIAFLKSQMYNRFNARPVIYGTTIPKEEKKDEFGNYFIDDFPEEELYRYMLTSIDQLNDWTHEREWRWNDPESKSTLDGLPIWRNSNYDEDYGSDDFFNYETLIIIVKTQQESEKLKELFRKKENPKIYNVDNIKNTFIYIIPEIMQDKASNNKDNQIRLDEIKKSDLISVVERL